MRISNQTYDNLKYTVQKVIPGLGTLYAAIAIIWGLPYAEEVVGSLSAIALFLGIILGYSSKKYEESGDGVQGAIIIDTEDPDKDVYRLELDGPPEALKDLKNVAFKVITQ